ncbi:MAG: tRNA (guanosine(46)-N7)-methyltransferase TrmB [Bacteroidetes bacterium]|nr:tRNA (guanosine(46)-N7)-methyltransferase TrmB [Bacteroidota bacterium]
MPLFLDLPKLPLPAKNVELFHRDAPVVLEIGFGDGSFLEWIAKTHPEWNCLGADVARGSVTRAFKRLRSANVSNVRMHHGSGLFLLRNVLSSESVSRVYVNFPDPWRKERHAEKRLFQHSFFELLAARLTADGSLLVTTDDSSYFEQTVSIALESGYYKVTKPPPPSAVLQTKYASKWREAGRSFYHAHIKKHVRHVPEFPPEIRKENGMHHALLNGSIPEITEFEKVVHHFPKGHVVILDVLQMIGQRGLVFVARSHEPELVQELFIQLRPTGKADADLLLSVMNFGNPIATRGTSEAVKAVSRWLTQQDLTLSGTYY